MGLVRALGNLQGPETYYLIVESQEELDWLKPHLGPNQLSTLVARHSTLISRQWTLRYERYRD